jgi:hypothetical protein
MRPAYYATSRPVRRRVERQLRVERPGYLDFYVTREASPYSITTFDAGMEGWGSIVKSVKKAVTQVAKVTYTAAKQAVVVQANIATLGAATRFTGMGKWSGTKTAARIGTAVGIGAAVVAAAVVGGPLSAGALAPSAGVAGAAATPSMTSMILSGIGTGLKGLAIVAPAAASYLKMSKAGQTSEILPGYGSGAYGGGAQSSSYGGSEIPSYGGGGGGGFFPGQDSGVAQPTDWLPIILIGGIGLALIMQRR